MEAVVVMRSQSLQPSTLHRKDTVVIRATGLDHLMIAYTTGVHRRSLLIIPRYILPKLTRLGVQWEWFGVHGFAIIAVGATVVFGKGL
jgi:hypothetical protein